MSYSEPYDFDEIPIRNKHGVIVGYAYCEGHAELAVKKVAGSPALDHVQSISLKAWEGRLKDQTIDLKDDDPLFLIIETELERLAEDGKIEFKRSADFEDDYEFQRKEYRAAQGY